MTVRWNAKPTLRRPALVAAFSGWNDAADAASDGVRWLARSVGARVFATLDTEEYLDFQAARPTVELVDGVIREIQWPALAFSAGSAPAGGRDLVLLLGVEPNLRWPTFCDDVISVARATGCEMVVTLGALLGDVPHSRPMRCTGSATDEVARRAPRHGAVALRRPDRHRRRAARRGAARRVRVGVDLGAGAALRRDRAEPEGDARAARPARDRCSTSASSSPTSRSRRRAWERSVDEVVAGDADASSYVERLEHRYDEAGRRRARRRRPSDDRRRRRRRLARRGRPAVGRVARRRLRALPPRAGRRVARTTIAASRRSAQPRRA